MSRDRRLPLWLQRLRPRRNRKTPPAPPADTVPLASARYSRSNDPNAASPDSTAVNEDGDPATNESATPADRSANRSANRSVWRALQRRATSDIETVSALATRLTDRTETGNATAEGSGDGDPTSSSGDRELDTSQDMPAWVNRLRPKQLENQLNQQFRQFQARQRSQANPESDDRVFLSIQFDRILAQLPQKLRVDRSDIERRFEAFARNAKPEDISTIIQRLPEMNRGAIREIWPKVRSLLEMIRDPSAAWTAKTLAIGALIYLISPFDAIPDFIPFVGLIDDAALIVAVVATLARQLDQYMRQSMQASVETAEKLAEIEVQKYNRIVRITLLGSIATALITIGLKLWLDNN